MNKTMHLTIVFFGFPELINTIGANEIGIDFPENNFGDLIKFLENRYKHEFKKAVLNRKGDIDSTVQVLINDNRWIERGNLSRQLNEGDKIIFLHMIAGG